MQLAEICKSLRPVPVAIRKTFIMMKIFFFMLLAFCFKASGKTFSQEITVTVNNANLESVFKEIKRQTNYRFIYTKEDLAISKKVTLDVKNAALETVLELCFRDQPLAYTIEDRYVIIRLKDKPARNRNSETQLSLITGRVINEQGEPVAGATIIVKGTNKGTLTNENGQFILQNTVPNDIIIVSSVGYQSQEINLSGRTNILVQLTISINMLDETVVIAYGITTKRLNTGNVNTLKADDIQKQPVSNPLAALSGRIPGMVITQLNGLPGSAFKVQIRGQNSIIAGNDPLFIIDGVPLAANNNPINQVGSALGSGGLSPFSVINPDDIESIEVLKDADATAIYGSRGANGVVLITTKKGKAGKIRTNINFWTGGSKVTRTMDMLNTEDYIALRREAFRNDNRTLTASSARDILVWDTTRYTDFKKLLIGGTAKTTNVQVSVSGGNELTQFLVGAGYRYESTVYPGDLSDNKTSFHFNINHSGTQQKFSLNLTGSMLSDRNRINSSDLTGYINLSPNTPALYDSTGQLNWQQGGFTFVNPLAYLKQEYVAETENLLGNLKISYRLSERLVLRGNLGYNNITLNDYSLYPISSQNPSLNPKGYNNFGNSRFTSLIAEPQAEYQHKLGKGGLTILVGSTWQQNKSAGSNITGYGYSNDALLKSIAAAPDILSRNNSYLQYRYAAGFGRITYKLHDKYIFNLNGRRDGSSRFGSDKQYSSFGSVAGAWLFHKEKFIEKHLVFFSYGKIRMSYGVTGNDQIGDYQYLNTWTATTQGIPGLYPTGINNPDFRWEKNKKFETAIEIGMFKDKLFLSIAYYNNRSSDHLVNYSLPSQTGSSSIISNFPAKIENTGIEIESSNQIIRKKKFSWASSFHVSIPKNRLLSFPGLASSSYSYLVEGRSLNLIAGYHVIGVDPMTGVYVFADKNGQAVNTPSESDRVKYLGHLDPRFYGGFQNVFKFHGLEMDIFMEYKKQTGRNYLYDLGFTIPGTMINQPIIILERWKQPGDITDIQKLTTRAGNPAFTAASIIRSSKAQILYGDASYIRMKTLSLSYQLPKSLVLKWKTISTRIYIQAQNLFTITNYKGSDPETQNLYRLPPLRTMTAGIQIIF